MARALVSTIIDQLGSLIASEFKDRLGSLFASEVTSIVNVEEEVEKLKLKFQAIQAKLDDAEERQVKEKAVKLWLERLNDVSYEMGDVLDEWNTAKIKADIEKKEEAETSTAKRRKVLSLPSLNSSVSTVFQRRDIALKIKEVMLKLDEIDREGDMYQFVLTSGNEEVVRPPTDSHVDVSNILGRDKVKGDLVSILLGRGSEEERSPHVISLVGMGGVGKTTLAQLAYNDSELNSAHFEKKGWVCVSDPFNKFMVAKAIIQAFEGDDSNITQWPSLMDKMCELIWGRKLFLVFDDVWTEDSMLWEPFKLALQNAAQGSRILVTTRKNRVADIMGSAARINLGQLSDDDCWMIFSTIAFSDRDSMQCKELEDIGRKISNKCKGLPLAARTLGSLMCFKSRKEQWEMVFYSRLWELQDVERGLFGPLLMSYYDLPSPLRRCFSYCAVFPKDYFFSKEDLISMWMAQGYIKSNANMERIVARDYLEILLIRSLFQDFRDYGYKENIMRFKMHDIVHDLAQFMAKNECITINGYEESRPNLQNARHLYLEIPQNAQIPESIYSTKNLRTLIFVGLRAHNLSKLFQHFKRLRTLTLSYQRGTKAMKLPDAIGNLLHLRYLKICYYSGGDILPETICNLCNLQILNIAITFENALRKLPQGMSKLINLKHLILNEDDVWSLRFKFPREIGRLSSLRKLSYFCVGGRDDSQRCELGELKYLNHLQGTLKIYGLGNVVDVCEAENAELKKKIGLCDLYLRFSEENVENHGGRMETDVSVLNALEPPPGLENLEIDRYQGTTMFPNWMMSLAKLKSLTLSSGLNLERLPPLGKLQFLEYLLIGKIYTHECYLISASDFPFKKVGVEFLGIESENKKDGIIKIFPNLKTLHFYYLHKWEEWIGIEGQEEEDCIIIMPCLQKLEIYDCPKLKSLPDFLFKTSLQEFEVHSSPILSKRYQIGTGEDYAKISHIPNIMIDFIEVQRDSQEMMKEESDEEEFDEEESDEEFDQEEEFEDEEEGQ
ncbi:putative disease resistance protein RGA3 isoform X1 [Quercus robur]|uniref:putative disease resistance protein RGA3 isoform X1 n=1 Tax=Quercus robur TaxID=38942 RepID=UPI0021639175|nr:putative disease resistance protein RGA3 isoform X1 [Quercus robur]